MIDVEAESEVLRERSLGLARLLDEGHPVVESPADVWSESRRLGQLAHQARRIVATRIALGQDPGAGVTVGRQPPVRRVHTDARTNRDVDPLGGRSAITPELIRFWQHKRDEVADAVEAQFRQAAEAMPYRPTLVAAAHGHLEVLRQRRSMLSEGGDQLEASLRSYDDAHVALRQAANHDPAAIRNEAIDRLTSLEREKASALLGDRDRVEPLIAAALASVSGAPIDVDTLTPLIPVA